MAITYHAVVPFDRNQVGTLVPGVAVDAPTAEAAGQWAKAYAAKHAGAVAFTRTGNPEPSAFDQVEIILSVGEVDLDALTA